MTIKPMAFAIAACMSMTSHNALAFFEVSEEPGAYSMPIATSGQSVHEFNANGSAPIAQDVEFNAPSHAGSQAPAQAFEWINIDRKPLRFVKEIGDGSAGIVKGFGKNQPLAESLRMISPEGWRGFAERDVGGHQRTINWRGGKAWTEVLDDIGMEEGLSFEIDWKTRKIFVKTAPRSLSATHASASHGDGSQIDVTPVPMPKSYSTRAGEMLSHELARWGEMAGWTVRWGVDYDYRIKVDTRFGTDMIESIKQVMEVYQSRGGLHGVIARISETNKIISIEPRK